MRKIWSTVAGLALATVVGAAPAQAQEGIHFGVGGGLNIPLGNFKDVSKLGWQLGAMAGFNPVMLPVGIRVDGMFVRNGTKDAALGAATSGHTQIISGTANAVYEFRISPDAKLRPYLIGGPGVYNTKFSSSAGNTTVTTSETKFGLNAGAGVNFIVSNLGLFLEGRFNNVFLPGSDLHYIPITLGVRLGFHPRSS